MLAVSQQLMLLGSQTKEMKWSDALLGQFIMTLVAVGDFCCHPETTVKHSSPEINVSPATTTPARTGPLCMGEAVYKTFLGDKSALIQQSCFYQLRCASAVYGLSTKPTKESVQALM